MGSFTVHCRLSPRFLLSNARGASEVNHLKVSPVGSLAFVYPEATGRGLRERQERGSLR